MENPIAISTINDFIFCPASIFYHNMYHDTEGLLYKAAPQVSGTYAHKTIDEGMPAEKNALAGIPVYSERFGLQGKIDKYYPEKQLLMESKKTIKTLYPGMVFQTYAQCLCLREMGYAVSHIVLYSISDNRIWNVPLPEDDKEMFDELLATLDNMRAFELSSFVPANVRKCQSCIYSPACGWGDAR